MVPVPPNEPQPITQEAPQAAPQLEVPLGTMPPEPSLVQPPPGPSKLPLIILFFLIFVGLVGSGYFILVKKVITIPFLSKPETLPSPSPVLSPSPSAKIATASATPSASASAKPNASASPSTLKLSQACQNEAIKISVKYPSAWTCKSETPVPANGTLTLKSALFEVNISNLGRGAPCESQEGSEGYSADCKKSVFYSNDLLALDLYSLKAVDKEIFGGLKEAGVPAATAPWIGITYKDIATKKLTSAQKTELTTILDSIALVK